VKEASPEMASPDCAIIPNSITMRHVYTRDRLGDKMHGARTLRCISRYLSLNSRSMLAITAGDPQQGFFSTVATEGQCWHATIAPMHEVRDVVRYLTLDNVGS